MNVAHLEKNTNAKKDDAVQKISRPKAGHIPHGFYEEQMKDYFK